MKFVCLLIMVFSLGSANAFAKNKGTYIGASYGIAESSSDVIFVDGIDGTVMGLNVGFHLSKALAFELTGRKTSFEKDSSSTDFAGTPVTFSSEMDALVVGAGLRLFFVKFLNVNFGLGYSTIDPKFEIDSALGGASSIEKSSGLGLYYGAGIQIPLGAIEITGDYLINNFSGDIGSNEITGGLRFKF